MYLFLSVCDHEVGVSDYSPDQFQASSSLDVNHDADKARLHKSTAWVARYILFVHVIIVIYTETDRSMHFLKKNGKGENYQRD